MPRVHQLTAIALLTAGLCCAQTQVVDTLYTSDSTPFSGTLKISWPPFVTAAGQSIAAGTNTLTIASGAVNMRLWPTAGAGPATSYTVQTIINGQLLATERWGVPVSASPVTLASVRNVTYSGTTPLGGVLTLPSIAALFTGSAPCYLNKDGTCSVTSGSGQPLNTFTPVSFSATPSFICAPGSNTFKITLTANVTSSSISGATAGQQVTLIVCQDSTGNRGFTWPSGFHGQMTIGTTANGCSAQLFVFDGSVFYSLSHGDINQ